MISPLTIDITLGTAGGILILWPLFQWIPPYLAYRRKKRMNRPAVFIKPMASWFWPLCGQICWLVSFFDFLSDKNTLLPVLCAALIIALLLPFRRKFQEKMNFFYVSFRGIKDEAFRAYLRQSLDALGIENEEHQEFFLIQPNGIKLQLSFSIYRQFMKVEAEHLETLEKIALAVMARHEQEQVA